MTFIPTPFTTPVVVPNVVAGDAYRRIPYISVADYRFAPTAVDTGSLVPGAVTEATASTASLAQVILRASAWVDEHCFHKFDGTLAASVTTEWDWVKVKPDGRLALICNFKPVREVVGVGIGPSASQAENLDPTAASDITVTDKVIWLPGVSSGGPRPFFGRWPSVNGMVYCVWQYVNGFPHMALATAAVKGATSLTVTPAVGGTIRGVQAGTSLTIRDGANTETVVVAQTPTSNTLSLSTPLQYAHALPAPPGTVLVSALPWQIEQATISLTSVLVKVQSDRALTLGGIGRPPSRVALGRAGATEDFDNAMRLLKPFVTAYVR